MKGETDGLDGEELGAHGVMASQDVLDDELVKQLGAILRRRLVGRLVLSGFLVWS